VKLCFIGTSFAPTHLKAAAVKRGFELTDDPALADLVFVSEDTPTDENGKRDLKLIEIMVRETYARTTAPLVLTSQVPPGFTRSLNLPIYHMAETLRVKDAEERAMYPEQFIIGWAVGSEFATEIIKFVVAFQPSAVHKCTWETAEFAKIAINMTLASQVESANCLSQAASRVGADWEQIIKILQHDKRIGPHAYLTPGRWQDSKHLYRDFITLKAIEDGRPLQD